MRRYLVKYIRFAFLLSFVVIYGICHAQDVISAAVHHHFSSQTSLDVMYDVVVNEAQSELTEQDFAMNIRCENGSNQSIRNFTVQRTMIGKKCAPDSIFHQLSFSKKIDLNDAEYAHLKACCVMVIDVQACCRGGRINLEQSSNNGIYVSDSFQNCGALKNSASAYENGSWPLFVIWNEPAYVSIGSFDAVEFDSISYVLTTPQSGLNQQAAFVSGLSKDNPFQVYRPVGAEYPYSDPLANPPLGFYFDAKRGTMIFTPTMPDTLSTAVQIDEFRSFNNRMFWVGKRTIELGMISITSSNVPPIILGKFEHSVCVGEQLCVTFTTDDKVKVPPPPLPAPMPDTVSLKWNRAIPGAGFTILNPGARHQTGRFCWIPTEADVSELPHSFVLTARDNSCPFPASVQRAINITVKPKPSIEYTIRPLLSPSLSFKIEAKSDEPVSFFEWRVFDMNHNPIFDRTWVHFQSNGVHMSRLSEDLVIFNRPQDFIISLFEKNAHCSDIIFDTIYAHQFITGNDVKPFIRVFPNPVLTGIAAFKSNFIVDKLTVYSIVGQVVMEITEPSEKINLGALLPATYIIRA
ncbi:MAG: hypothetical protein ACI9NN_001244, partial [Bacteroidia bacterium]